MSPARAVAPGLIDLTKELRVENAGLFISSGEGAHSKRRLASYEIILVRSGCLRLREENVTLKASEGEVLILHPNRWHSGIGEYAKDLAFYWLHFRLPARKARKLRLPSHVTPARQDRLIELFHWFLDDQENGVLSPVRVRCLVLLILEEILQPHLSKKRPESRLATLIEESVAANFSQKMRQQQLAASLGFSADHLERIFKKSRGKTIAQFIRERRISEARSLLLKSKLQMKEIALRCGYANAPHFTRSFHKATGLTPNQFRTLYPKTHINLH